MDRLRAAGIVNINVDLIAGLPHQTAESLNFSLEQTLATGAPHVSVYMLEVDEDSRLGRELIAGGTRYHAHFVPDEGEVADFYIAACDRLSSAGIAQYEISNFAREGFESRHNLKYWTRQPYLGFGVDAHSMLLAGKGGQSFDRKGLDAIRFSADDALEKYTSGAPLLKTSISTQAALEESFFLGLRLTHGVNLEDLSAKFGDSAIRQAKPTIAELIADGLMERSENFVRLTSRGKLFSNEVFERFIQVDQVV
jgi:oxygen-independent coproporphyrinogen-3 oxidase